MEKTAIVLQARMGSARLPGKVLAKIGTRTILDRCVSRLAVSGLPVIVATTTREEDEAIEREARRLGVDVYRGDADDVLSRFIAVAQAFGLTEIIRATADNPLVDCDGPRRVLDLSRRVRADHVVESGLPIGAAVEAVRVDALERARTLITDPYDLEHVTSFIRRDSRFRALRAVAPGDRRRPGLRLTVDTPEDLEFVRAVVERIKPSDSGGAEPDLGTIIRTAEALLVTAVAQRRAQKGA